MSVFFVGLNPRWQMYKFLPMGLNMMFNAASYWDEDERDWRRPLKRFPRKAGLKFLDSGGYLALLRWGYYPYSVVNFCNLIAAMRPDLYAGMDYCTEPELSTKCSLTISERLEKTTENALELAWWEDQLPGRFLPVIQGWTLGDYQSHLETYHKAGLIRPYMGVGSMCRRFETDELEMFVTGIYNAARQYKVERLHWFGMKLDPKLVPLRDYIYSRDSAVSMMHWNPDLIAAQNGRRFPRGQQEKRAVFLSFLDAVDRAGLRYAGGVA